MTLRVHFSVFAALALVFALAGPALAYDHTNYAGRPNTATFLGDCHWTIYGKVNGQDALFGPYHCHTPTSNLERPGQPVLGQYGGARLGTVAFAPAFATAADMTWIWLDTGQKPFDKNEIPYNGGSWSISTKIPHSSLTCPNLLLENGALSDDTMKVSYWTETNGYEGPFAGETISSGSEDHGSGNCLIRTTVDFDAGSIRVPSGAPWLDATIGGSGFLGVTTQCYVSCGHGADMMFNSWRQAIIDLNNYYANGAWFCSNDACT